MNAPAPLPPPRLVSRPGLHQLLVSRIPACLAARPTVCATLGALLTSIGSRCRSACYILVQALPYSSQWPPPRLYRPTRLCWGRSSPAGVSGRFIKALRKWTSFFGELGQHPWPQRRNVSGSSDNLEYKKIGPEHYDHVMEHLRRNFFPNEPMNKAAGLCQDGNTNVNLEKKALESMQERLSLMSVEPHPDCCKIAGVALNCILKAGDTAKALNELPQSCDPEYQKMFTMLFLHNIKNDLFKEFPVDSIFEVRILSVDSSYRDRGIARNLIQKSEAVARRKGFLLMKADSTGIFSQKVFRSLGFSVFSEEPYDQYTDDDGRIILPVEAPHTTLQLVYKILCKETEDEQKLSKK